MSGENDKRFRVLREREKGILERLLGHHPFDGRDELLKQLESTTARLKQEYDDNYGSIELTLTRRLALMSNAEFRWKQNTRMMMESQSGCCSMFVTESCANLKFPDPMAALSSRHQVPSSLSHSP